jgi:peptide deformylase
MTENPIWLLANKTQAKLLRKKAVLFNFEEHSKKEITDLIQRMRKNMKDAEGIGLAANQIGLPFSAFVAQVPEQKGGYKFYAVFNPTLEKVSRETASMDEGCLSVPLTYGSVERPERVTLTGFDKNGKPIKIKAWGLLARVFQHEADHLNGILFIDKAKDLQTITPEEKAHK